MKYGRVYNFSAGPSMLPEAVLEEVQIELLNYQGSGMSVMEMSHRSKVFEDILHEAEKDLRELMNIPDNYKVLFIQGGGTLQFAMVPMNLMKNGAESIANASRPPAQRSVELRVVPRQIDGVDGVEFSVQDTGKGLAPEVLERLFEAFFSTKEQGMGMGLNLCRSIVEAHQGRMQAENIYNGPEVTGCRFTFWLPLAAPATNTTNVVANTEFPRTTA